MKSALYGIYAFVVFVSEISLVRFLIRQHLVRKYCMHALSVKNFMSAFFFVPTGKFPIPKIRNWKQS